MATDTAGVAQFPAPGLHGERRLETSEPWFAEACWWLQRSVRAPGTAIWPLILVPELIDRRFRVSEEAVQIYHSVQWAEPVPSEPFDISASVEWISPRGSSVEFGMSSRAMVGGLEAARSLVVVRAEGRAEAFGERNVTGSPTVGSVLRQHSFVIGEDQVRTFAEFAGSRYRLHDDVRSAQQRGFPTVLVQGAFLLSSQLHYAAPASAGRAEMWFKKPVPAGCALEICRSEEDPDLWVFRLVASRDVAAIARLVSPSSEHRSTT